MRAARAALAAAAILAVGVVLVSGGSDADPRTPAPLPGLPPPFLGTTVSGDGGMTAALDAYGDVVNLYAPGPAGAAAIVNSSARQAAGTVPSDTGIVPRVRVGDGPALPFWRAEAVRQHYLPGTNAVRTAARFGAVRVVEIAAVRGGVLAVVLKTGRRPGEDGGGATSGGEDGGGRGPSAEAPSGSAGVGGSESVKASLGVHISSLLRCETGRRGDSVALLCRRDRSGIGGVHAGAISSGVAPSQVVSRAEGRILRAAHADRRWLAAARPLGSGAPDWAPAMYSRSLLTLRALTGRNGAAVAGAREGWAYVWPRDAATDALALEAAGYRPEARRVAHFLSTLPTEAAARFDERGDPVPGRGPQGDAAGWIAAAERATSLSRSTTGAHWRGRPDYQEGAAGDYLGNAIAAAGVRASATSAAHPPERGRPSSPIG